MNLTTELYTEQSRVWPRDGRHILAQFDAESVIVYQAYRPSIGHFAAQHGYFGGEFSFSRMSWIKTNFLWMMYRSGWGTKENQEVTLAIRLRRAFFERLLELAVPSNYIETLYPSYEAWSCAVQSSNVRLQWDPDHAPDGTPQQRRAIQLGMRGEVLREYAREAVLGIDDISPFVTQQRALSRGPFEGLSVPKESVYWPDVAHVATQLGLEQQG
jgi:hypothetical protein